MVVLGGVAVSYERGTPVDESRKGAVIADGADVTGVPRPSETAPPPGPYSRDCVWCSMDVLGGVADSEE